MASVAVRRPRKFVPGLLGGLYSDHEPGKVKPTRIKPTPDEPQLGIAARKLLESEEKIPARLGRNGFKEVRLSASKRALPNSNSTHLRLSASNLDRPNTNSTRLRLSTSSLDRPNSNSTRRVVISDHVSSRLYTSIVLSDDESDEELLPRSKRKKVISRVAVNRTRNPVRAPLVNPIRNPVRAPLKVQKLPERNALREVLGNRNRKNDEDREVEPKISVKSRIGLICVKDDVMILESVPKRNYSRPNTPIRLSDSDEWTDDEIPCSSRQATSKRTSTSSKSYSDSSFTDSSGDERYKMKARMKSRNYNYPYGRRR